MVGDYIKLEGTVNSQEEKNRIATLLNQTFEFSGEIYFLKSEQNVDFERLKTTIEVNKINEVIFCAKDLSSGQIIETMTSLPQYQLEFKIAQPSTDFLIGSNSIDSSGDLYLVNLNKIERPKNIRLKRITDLGVASLLLVCSPLIIWRFGSKRNFLTNLTKVFFGKLSLVGFAIAEKTQTHELPRIKKGILTPTDTFKNVQPDQIAKVNLLYARDYSIWYDLKLLKNCWGKLDKTL